MTTTDTTTATTAWAAFDKTTSRWGRLTMIAAMIIMIGGPGIIAAQLGVKPLSILAGVLAIAAVFGAVWFVEPLSYFPILGAASMYQAFMIGNISNKLLPAAIVAQATIEAKPETKRGQLAAVLAICGAAAMHLTTLAILVGSGTPLLRALDAARDVVWALPLRRAASAAAGLVREGVPVARALKEQRMFPPVLVHLVANGEASGQLAPMLERAAAELEREAERRLTWFAALLQPALIVAMGAIVLLLVLAVMLPIVSMNQLIR